MKKKRKGFFVGLTVALATIVALVFSVYLILDKVVVPKYFKEYGIENMHDLVGMVKTLYNSPDEDDLITHGYTVSDQRSAVKKLIGAGIPKISDTELDFVAISNGLDQSSLVKGEYKFSDREIAGLLDQMLESGIMASKLPNIKYLDTININVLEIIITPEKETLDGGIEAYREDKARVDFTFRLDTSSVRTQMAAAMDTPLFLLNMIVPKTLYITVNYEIEKDADGGWSVPSGKLAINGRTAKDSEILLNLLIEFIFPAADEMTIDKLINECGNIMIRGLDLLGGSNLYFGENGVVGMSVII